MTTFLYFSALQHAVNGPFQHAHGFDDTHALHLAGRRVQMSAASHALHDDLYIHLVNGTGADMDLPLEVCQHKAGFDSLDIQQFIGSLGADMVGLGRSSAVQMEMVKHCL